MVVNLPLYLLFEGKPEKIIKPYLELAQETIFPTMTQKIYNDWIEKIRKRAGITKHFSSHTARHTFGMEMVQKYPIAVVSKMMGHASVATTEVYARMKTATIDAMLKG
jgi:site-specific recombinase XerD